MSLQRSCKYGKRAAYGIAVAAILLTATSSGMAAGRSLWDELVIRYGHGVDEVKAMRATWDSLAPYVDAARHHETAAFLAIQQQEAQWWRDACVAYFQSLSGRPLPPGQPAPAHPLPYYQALSFPFAPGI